MAATVTESQEINRSPLLLRGQSEGVLGELVVVGPAGRVHPLAAQVAQRLLQLLPHVVVGVPEILLQVYLYCLQCVKILCGFFDLVDSGFFAEVKN